MRGKSGRRERVSENGEFWLGFGVVLVLVVLVWVLVVRG